MPAHDMMEMSPLPAKSASHVHIVPIEVHSPTPVPSPDEMMVESPENAVTVETNFEPPKPVVAE